MPDYAAHKGQTVYRVTNDFGEHIVSSPDDESAVRIVAFATFSPWSLSAVSVPANYPESGVSYRQVATRQMDTGPVRRVAL